jgi:hypothetical protein
MNKEVYLDAKDFTTQFLDPIIQRESPSSTVKKIDRNTVAINCWEIENRDIRNPAMQYQNENVFIQTECGLLTTKFFSVLGENQPLNQEYWKKIKILDQLYANVGSLFQENGQLSQLHQKWNTTITRVLSETYLSLRISFQDIRTSYEEFKKLRTQWNEFKMSYDQTKIELLELKSSIEQECKNIQQKKEQVIQNSLIAQNPTSLEQPSIQLPPRNVQERQLTEDLQKPFSGETNPEISTQQQSIQNIQQNVPQEETKEQFLFPSVDSNSRSQTLVTQPSLILQPQKKKKTPLSEKYQQYCGQNMQSDLAQNSGIFENFKKYGADYNEGFLRDLLVPFQDEFYPEAWHQENGKVRIHFMSPLNQAIVLGRFDTPHGVQLKKGIHTQWWHALVTALQTAGVLN